MFKFLIFVWFICYELKKTRNASLNFKINVDMENVLYSLPTSVSSVRISPLTFRPVLVSRSLLIPSSRGDDMSERSKRLFIPLKREVVTTRL